MAMIRSRLMVGWAAIAVAAASCASTAHPVRRALPVPTQKPCVAPSAADLSDLASQSGVVVEATIGSGAAATTQVGSGSDAVTINSTPLTAVKVLARPSNVSAQAVVPTSMVGAGFSWSEFLSPGRYLLFLLSNGEPTQGFYGIFRIDSGSLARQCPNYQDPVHPLTATGTQPAVAVAESEIPTVLSDGPDAPATPSSALES